MNTTTSTTKTTKKMVPTTKTTATKKAETFRSYLYTNKTNNNWIEKNSKAFGSKAKFLDALVTAARKTKLEVKAPVIKKTAKKAAKKAISKKITKNTKTINKLKA